MDIPFNKPYLSGKEAHFVAQSAFTGKISGNGVFTKKCHRFFEEKYGFKKALLTSSCTDALEMAALLSEVGEGDEVIIPSFTFVSTANAFALRGAKIVFADVQKDIPNIDLDEVAKLITPKTKVIVVVHYAGVAVDMDRLMAMADRHRLLVVEDAAHAIDSYYKNRPLGSIGHMATFSFHETKNIISGEGGLLVVNDERFVNRAEIIWEKGTNRAAFDRGEVDEYGWVDLGSSFLPSDMTAAFLYSQLQEMGGIQRKRKAIWEKYHKLLAPLKAEGKVYYPEVPGYATKNGNMFYISVADRKKRDKILSELTSKGILAVFHYLPLHQSKFFKDKHDGRNLPNTQMFSDTIIRLPFFVELAEHDIVHICDALKRVL